MLLLESFSSSFHSSGVFWAAIWWLALSGIVAWLAHGKGQSPTGFLAIALFFSPVIGLLALMAARDLRSVSDAQMARDDFRHMLGPLLLQIDGIRGHLAVAKEPQGVPPPPEDAAMPSRRGSVTAPSQATGPGAEPVLVNGTVPS